MGTNNLNSEKLYKAIAQGIMDIAVFIKLETLIVSVSNIIVHTHNQELNLKAIEVNIHLTDFCKEISFSLTDILKRMKV